MANGFGKSLGAGLGSMLILGVLRHSTMDVGFRGAGIGAGLPGHIGNGRGMLQRWLHGLAALVGALALDGVGDLELGFTEDLAGARWDSMTRFSLGIT